MRRHLLQTFTAWLCLAIFMLTSVMMPRGLVMCHDGHGTRLEIGCERDGHGHCEDSLAVAHSSDGAEAGACGGNPCQDTPLRPEIVVGRNERPWVFSPPPMFALSTAVVFAIAEPVRLHVSSHPRDSWLPPPAAPHLRSTILLV